MTVTLEEVEKEVEDDKQKETGEEEAEEEDAGTDELVDAAPVVESPCHCEQLASVSRGLPPPLLYGSSRKVRREFALAAAGARATGGRPVGVADPSREGVRSVPSSFASGVFRASPRGKIRCALLKFSYRE